MLSPRVRLLLAVVVFAAWTVFIAFEALTTARPIVVSRPQIYLAEIVIEADVPAEEGMPRQVTVTRVYRGQQLLGIPPNETEPKSLRIVVSNFGRARGWQGPDRYFLALEKADRPDGVTTFDLVSVPASPGFPPPDRLELAEDPPIYLANPSTRAQVLEALEMGGK